MTLDTFDFSSILFRLPAAVVGGVLIWTGAIKAIAPQTFRSHLFSLGWIPPRFVKAFVTAAAGLEAGWGAALVVQLWPAVVFPLSIGLLMAFSVVAWWGVKSGKTADCGCYGGYIQPSIRQSVALNGLFIALILISWMFLQSSVSTNPWQILIPLVASFGIGGVAEWAQRYEMKTGIPKFTPSPLTDGAMWKDSWANGLTRNARGELIVAMLGPDCPFCKQWVKVGNAMTASASLPTVYGVVGASPERRDEFVREHGIRFPVATISPSLMSRLAAAVPTSVLIENGLIKEIWVGSMPPEFVQRFRRAFFPDALLEQSGSK